MLARHIRALLRRPDVVAALRAYVNGDSSPVILDYPTAWRIVKQTKPEHHHEKCSFRQSTGGVLCDCAVVDAIRATLNDTP